MEKKYFEILEFIKKYLEKKQELPKNTDLKSFNYIETGYVDSLGIIKFVVELENRFQVEFSDEELSSPSFKVAGDLAEIVVRKIGSNE